MQLRKLRDLEIKSMGNIEFESKIDFSKKLYTFGKQHKLRKLIKYPLLGSRELVDVLGEITWVINHYYPQVDYCPTLFFVLMLLVNFFAKERAFYVVKTMIGISTVD